jgi:hypothetical protein
MLKYGKPVIDYEELYEVSNYGRIRRIRDSKGRLLVEPSIRKNNISRGYPMIILSKNNIPKTFKIHVRVCRAFMGERPKGHDCNHIDGNKLNNKLSNLEYVSHQKNVIHAIKLGLKKFKYGADNHASKLNWSDYKNIIDMRINGMQFMEIAKIKNVHHETISKIYYRYKDKL